MLFAAIPRRLRSAGKPAKIILISDRDTLGTSFDEVAHVKVRLVDEDGTLVPQGADLLSLSVTGAGKIVGLDSGSIVGTKPFGATTRSAFQGRALAIVRATGAGGFTVSASAPGLAAATLKWETSR